MSTLLSVNGTSSYETVSVSSDSGCDLRVAFVPRPLLGGFSVNVLNARPIHAFKRLQIFGVSVRGERENNGKGAVAYVANGNVDSWNGEQERHALFLSPARGVDERCDTLNSSLL